MDEQELARRMQEAIDERIAKMYGIPPAPVRPELPLTKEHLEEALDWLDKASRVYDADAEGEKRVFLLDRGEGKMPALIKRINVRGSDEVWFTLASGTRMRMDNETKVYQYVTPEFDFDARFDAPPVDDPLRYTSWRWKYYWDRWK